VSAPAWPVVEAVVWADGSAWSRKIVEQSTPDEGRDLPALAVPDAAWTDSAFNDAVRERVAWNYGHVGVHMMAAFLDAIHAELRARAGGAE
jgi:hypothetical protein